MVKHSIKVYARLKKEKTSGKYEIIERNNHDTVIFHYNTLSYSNQNHKFRFHKAFGNDSSQNTIYEHVGKPVVNSFLNGYNGTILAYGQTGSGKTFSMTGSPKNYNNRGLIPRCIETTFDFIKTCLEYATVYISYLEIYNEIAYDLLTTKPIISPLEQLPRVVFLEDTKGNVHIKNLNVLPASNVQEAMRLLFLGDTNRTIAETPLNEYSSRSHCVFTLYLSTRNTTTHGIIKRKLNLVDLAGSERIHKSKISGITLNEAKNINLSLHYLERVILALSTNKNGHIPYRNSVMTYLLKDSLSGNCMTAMLATLSTSVRNFEETLSTCKFAERVSLIDTDATINEEIDTEREINLLKSEIVELRNKLGDYEQNHSSELDKKEKTILKKMVDDFLQSNDSNLLLNIANKMPKVQYCFKLLKHAYKSVKEQNKVYQEHSKTMLKDSKASSSDTCLNNNKILKENCKVYSTQFENNESSSNNCDNLKNCFCEKNTVENTSCSNVSNFFKSIHDCKNKQENAKIPEQSVLNNTLKNNLTINLTEDDLFLLQNNCINGIEILSNVKIKETSLKNVSLHENAGVQENNKEKINFKQQILQGNKSNCQNLQGTYTNVQENTSEHGKLQDNNYKHKNLRLEYNCGDYNDINSKEIDSFNCVLKNKYSCAEIIAKTMEECQENIIKIKEKLDNLNCFEMPQSDVQVLHNQLIFYQNIYRESIIKLQETKNEIEHLKNGLRQAEIKTKAKNMSREQTFVDLHETNRHPNVKLHEERLVNKNRNVLEFKVKENCSKTVSESKSNEALHKNGCVFENNHDQLIDNLDNYYTDRIHQNFNDGVRNTSKTLSQQEILLLPSTSKNSYVNIDLLQILNEENFNLLLEDVHENKNEKVYKINTANNESISSCSTNSSSSQKNVFQNDKTKDSYTSSYQSSKTSVSDNTTIIIDDNTNLNNFIQENDSQEFIEFMKNVPLTGDNDIDDEIFKFYRGKFN